LSELNSNILRDKELDVPGHSDPHRTSGIAGSSVTEIMSLKCHKIFRNFAE